MIVEDDITEIPLRRFQRTRRSTILNDYVVYLQEHEFDVGMSFDPVSFHEAIDGPDFSCWIHAMHDEMTSMCHNNV